MNAKKQMTFMSFAFLFQIKKLQQSRLCVYNNKWVNMI